MSARDANQKTLLQACAIVGDETRLAQVLGVPVPQVVEWLVGTTEIPTGIFLRAIDIVLGNTRRQVQDQRALLEEIKKRHAR